MKCYVCGREMHDAVISFKNAKLTGWKCPCGEEVLPSREVVRYEFLAGLRKSDIRTVASP